MPPSVLLVWEYSDSWLPLCRVHFFSVRLSIFLCICLSICSSINCLYLSHKRTPLFVSLSALFPFFPPSFSPFFSVYLIHIPSQSCLCFVRAFPEGRSMDKFNFCPSDPHRTASAERLPSKLKTCADLFPLQESSSILILVLYIHGRTCGVKKGEQALFS